VNAPVRFGFLGGGRVAQDFATGLSVVEGAMLSAVASRSAATANAFAARFPEVRVLAGYDAVLADPEVDVVYVATPHHLHAAQSIAALEAGKAVLCEKPFTMDAAEAHRVVEVARRTGGFCMEAMWMRFFPVIRRAKEIVANGTIGEARLLHADFGVPTAAGSDSRFYDPAQGGGALLDRGVYAVSLATLLFGRPTDVLALEGPTATGVDEHVGIVMRFEGGRLAILSASLTSLTHNTALVCGTHGSVAIAAPFFCPERLALRHYRAAEVESAPTRRDELVALAKRTRPGRAALRTLKPLLAGRPTRFRAPMRGNGYGYEADEVVRCLRSGELESPLMTLDDSVTVMEALDAARAAARSGG
jgi:dihydrodiol dehydrogenase / D-xylose 1-dehydrogenase (NADP)